ncbi:hypothetical protein [Cellulosimicrobium protaetiae]
MSEALLGVVIGGAITLIGQFLTSWLTDRRERRKEQAEQLRAVFDVLAPAHRRWYSATLPVAHGRTPQQDLRELANTASDCLVRLQYLADSREVRSAALLALNDIGQARLLAIQAQSVESGSGDDIEKLRSQLKTRLSDATASNVLLLRIGGDAISRTRRWHRPSGQKDPRLVRAFEESRDTMRQFLGDSA